MRRELEGGEGEGQGKLEPGWLKHAAWSSGWSCSLLLPLRSPLGVGEGLWEQAVLSTGWSLCVCARVRVCVWVYGCRILEELGCVACVCVIQSEAEVLL